jgi:hypothetical protein
MYGSALPAAAAETAAKFPMMIITVGTLRNLSLCLDLEAGRRPKNGNGIPLRTFPFPFQPLSSPFYDSCIDRNSNKGNGASITPLSNGKGLLPHLSSYSSYGRKRKRKMRVSDFKTQ